MVAVFLFGFCLGNGILRRGQEAFFFGDELRVYERNRSAPEKTAI